MTTNLQRASLVSRYVQLEAVNLVTAQLDTSLDPVAPPDHLELTQGYRCGYELREDRPDHLYVQVEFRFDGLADGAGEAEHVVRLEAQFLALYSLSGAHTYPEDALRHFAELNGAYNVWPYWRELVQTVSGRVGLAAIVVPVFTPPVAEIDEQEHLALDEATDKVVNENAPA